MEKFFYRVLKGDSVVSVGAKFHVPPLRIVKSNNLTAELREGDVIFVEESRGVRYAVKPFESVEDVAEKFGVSAEDIKRANGVDYLYYGLTVIIPDNKADGF